MIIGVDFDNTIIRYDEAFAASPLGAALVERGVAPTKLAIRDHLRAAGRENEWTALQAEIYGPGIVNARPFPGVEAFFRACREMGLPVRVVSHKTRRPYLGPDYDLHGFARGWLEDMGFFYPAQAGIDREFIFFEPTKAEKAQRIRALGITLFIDDLPEFLTELTWTPLVRVLFDPNAEHGPVAGMVRAGSWTDILALVRAGAR